MSISSQIQITGFLLAAFAGQLADAQLLPAHTGLRFNYGNDYSMSDREYGNTYDLHPASQAMSQLQTNKQQYLQTVEARRYDNILRRQEWAVRVDIKKLQQELAEVDTVATGAPSSFHQIRCFYQLAQQYGSDEAVYSLMNSPTSKLNARDFVPRSITFRVLTDEGKLRRLPLVLTKSAECADASQKMHQAWNTLWQQCCEASEYSYEAIEQFQAAADEFIATGKRTLTAAKHGSATYSGRQYVKSVQTLANRIHDEAMQQQLSDVIAHHKMRFAGGTLRDLLDHLFENQLVIKQGSTAQWQLNSLAERLRNNIDAQIVQKQEKLEMLKAQHDWHNSPGPWGSQGGGLGAGGSVTEQMQSSIRALTASTRL